VRHAGVEGIYGYQVAKGRRSFSRIGAMRAIGAMPSGTLAVTVKAYGENPSHRLEVPINRIECVCGFAHSGNKETNLNSWIGVTPIEGPDPLRPYMPKHPARMEVEEPPWALVATLGMLGVDLVQVYGTRASSARQIEFAACDHVVAIIPTGLDMTAMCAKGLQGSGCTILRSGTEMSGYRNPTPELIDRIFGGKAKRIATSSGDYAAVLPDFYLGATEINPKGRLMVGIAIGDSPDARTMQVETNVHAREIPGVLEAGAQLLETQVLDPTNRVLNENVSGLDIL
jgi:hypothetical protein